MIDKHDMLLIRTCKARKISLRRLKRIFGIRCGVATKYISEGDITYHLLHIIEKHNLCGLTKFYYEVAQSRMYRGWGRVLDIDDLTMACVNIIAFSEVAKFENYISPAYFRNEKLKKVS